MLVCGVVPALAAAVTAAAVARRNLPPAAGAAADPAHWELLESAVWEKSGDRSAANRG